jgi:phage major head subunit gpT-like protein
MAEYRADWADLLDPSIRKVYNDEWDQLPSQRQSIFNMLSSSKKDETESSASGLSKMVEMPEGSSLTYEDANQGYDVTYTHKKWGLGSQITYEMFQDDQTNVMNTRTRALARAKARTLEQSAADILNNGFTAGGGGMATFTSGDAKALFATDHPRSDGGAAQGNYTTADLAEDSLEVALTTMRSTVDDKGQLILIRPDTLVVAPALEKEAMILLDSKGRTGTANNDINPYEGRLKLVVWDYLGSAAGGSDTAWFVLDSSNSKLNWFTRDDRGLEGPETDFDTKTAKWSVVCRWSVGFSDWRGIYGSKGDNS